MSLPPELDPDYIWPLDLRVIQTAYDFQIGRYGWILGLTAGDQCWEHTGIRLGEADQKLINAGIRLKRMFSLDDPCMDGV